MNMKRHFQALAFIALMSVQVSVAQAQSSQIRGGWTGLSTSAPQINSSSQPVDAIPSAKREIDKASDPLDPPPNSKDSKKGTIVGSWLLTVKVPDNAPPFDSFKAFWALTQDGILIASAQGDVTPAPFPSVTSQYGAYVQTGNRQFAATFKAVLYDLATGDNLGMFKVRQTITLSDSGDEWSGPFKLTVYDPDGNVVAEVPGTVEATRIKVEPLD